MTHSATGHDTVYYNDKLDCLRSIFGTQRIELESTCIVVEDRRYPVLDDVIICLAEAQWPAAVRQRLGGPGTAGGNLDDFAADIQFTFAQEWQTFSAILPEHRATFHSYFDLVDLDALRDKRLCDLGCGMGRWSYFASEHCREIVLVDFSEAIFVARNNLRARSNAVFVMADIRRLPFASDFADLLFSLGVLHHLPVPALEEVVALARYAPTLLIYLYYALDNRPVHFRLALQSVTAVRTTLARIRNPLARSVLTTAIAALVYEPLVTAGRVAQLAKLGHYVPLYEAYRSAGWSAIRQDTYDRFFTRIEQRVTRKDIRGLSKSFSRIHVSDNIPYWHFLCER